MCLSGYEILGGGILVWLSGYEILGGGILVWLSGYEILRGRYSGVPIWL